MKLLNLLIDLSFNFSITVNGDKLDNTICKSISSNNQLQQSIWFCDMRNESQMW